MQKKSFTLVELMIVIAILAILSAIVIFALNPARLFDNFRDSKRVTDISSINKAIVFMESWNQSGITYGTTTNVYISLPDSNSNCSSYTLPALPVGYTYYCSSPASYRLTDGSGWIPINFTVSNSNKYLPSLPVDPVNDTSYFYTYYTGGSYELTALLSNANKNSIDDGGIALSVFELGSPNRTFTTPLIRGGLDVGLVGYWKLDDVNTTAIDSSITPHDGIIINGANSVTLASGEKVINFEGQNDHISINNPDTKRVDGQAMTVGAWVYFRGGGDYRSLVAQRDNTGYNWMLYIHSNGVLGFHGNAQYPSAYAMPTNQWKYLSATVTTDRIATLYVNGVSILTTNPYLYHADNVSTLMFATSTGFAEFFNGYIDDVRIYNRALSATEILSIYNLTASRYQ